MKSSLLWNFATSYGLIDQWDVTLGVHNRMRYIHAGESIGLNVNFPGTKKVFKITFRALFTLGDGSLYFLTHKSTLNLIN